MISKTDAVARAMEDARFWAVVLGEDDPSPAKVRRAAARFLVVNNLWTVHPQVLSQKSGLPASVFEYFRRAADRHNEEAAAVNAVVIRILERCGVNIPALVEELIRQAGGERNILDG